MTSRGVLACRDLLTDPSATDTRESIRESHRLDMYAGTPPFAASTPLAGVARACALVACLVATVIGVSGVLGFWRVAALGTALAPSAPIAAFLIALVNAAIVALSRSPTSRAVRQFAWGVALLSAVVGALVLVRSYWAGIPAFEMIFVPGRSTLANPFVGRLAPPAAATLLATALSLVFLLAPSRRFRPWETMASVFAILVAASGLIAVIGYGLGGSLLGAGRLVPMALPTGLLFLLTALALLLSAHPRMWSRRERDEGESRYSAGFRWAVRGSALVLTSGFLLTGYSSIKSEHDQLRTYELRGLSAVAELKAREMAHWFRERAADAVVLVSDVSVRRDAGAVLAGRDAGAAREAIQARLRTVNEQYGYDHVDLLDHDARRVVSWPDSTADVCPELAKLVVSIPASGGVAFTPLHRERASKGLGLAVVVPILGTEEHGTSGPVGYFALHAGAEDTVYPILRDWPTPSRTGKSVLLGPLDGQLRVLSEDPFGADPRTLGVTVDGSAGGLANDAGPWSGEATDYRGTRTFAAVRPVAGLPWLILTKVDRDEAFEPLRGRVWFVSMALSLLAVGTVLGLALVRRQRDSMALERELHERQRREDAEQNYRTLFREMLDGFALHEIICDSAGEPIDYRFLAVNPAFEKLTGLKAVNIIGRTVLSVLPGTERQWIKTYGRVALTGEPSYFESYTEPLDKYFEVTAFRPSPGQFACIFVDITERRRADQALRQSEEKFATVFRTTPAAISITRLPSGDLLDVNDAFLTMTGYSRDEAVGRTSADLGLWLDRTDRDAVLAALAAGAPLWNRESVFRRKDGELVIGLMSAHTLRINGETCVLSIITDITERKRTQDLLIQTEKMMSVGGLAAGMAHEINNPLGIIRQAIENVDRRLSADLRANHDAAAASGTTLDALKAYQAAREIPAFLDDIRAAASRASDIVIGMLRFARKSDSSKTPVDLVALLEQAIKLASNDLTLQAHCDFRRIEIVLEYDPALPAVMAASREIEQVFLNLLTNAGHAMAATAGERQPVLTLRTSRDDHHAVVEVADNGPGMTADVLRRAFEPFFTTKPQGSGTGLGLSVAYAIVTQNHGGHILADSVPGVGSSFRIRLPLSPVVPETQPGADSGVQDG